MEQEKQTDATKKKRERKRPEIRLATSWIGSQMEGVRLPKASQKLTRSEMRMEMTLHHMEKQLRKAIAEDDAELVDVQRTKIALHKQKMQRAAKRHEQRARIYEREIRVEQSKTPPIQADAIVAFDLEGAGYVEDDIIEIGAVKIHAETGTVSTFHVLIAPRTHLNKHVIELTGIRREDLIGKRTLAEELPAFFEFVGDAVVLGHAIADNDIMRINMALERCKLPQYPTFYPHFIDTEHVAHRLLDGRTPPVRKFGLTALLARYGLALPTQHRAVEDAIASYVLLRQLLSDTSLRSAQPERAHPFWRGQEHALSVLLRTCVAIPPVREEEVASEGKTENNTHDEA